MSAQVETNSNSVSPEVFFEHIVPAVLKATESARKQMSGSFEMAVLNGAARSWTIDLSEGRVHRGTHGKTDCYIEMGLSEFQDMMHDRLDVAAAIRAGKVRFTGKAPVLAHFAAIMRPSTVGY